MRSRKSLSKFGDFEDKIVSEMVVGGSVESVEHFRNNYLYIFLGGHFEE